MDIEKMRSRIDAIDAKLVSLLNKRAKTAVEIGKAKKSRGIPVHDPKREAEVLNRVGELGEGPLERKVIRDIYCHIVS
ncbi:MAG: chorismate mutase, partial [Lentisphaerae bacterium]|nr:chorismate mutase [Lentisphaerota bacterium]